MKKLIALIFAIFCSCSMVYAQQTVEFAPTLLPSHSYKINFRGYVSYQFDVIGDRQAIQRIISQQGLSLPVTVAEATTFVATAVTKQADSSHIIPVNLEYNKSEVKRQVSQKELLGVAGPDRVNSLAGHTVAAHVQADGSVKLDTPDSEMWIIKPTDFNLRDCIDVLNLPQKAEKALKIGNSFTVVNPYFIEEPFENSNLNCERKTTFKLTQIVDNKAYFEIVQRLSGQVDGGDQSGRMTGKGTGTMVYDITQKMPLNYSVTLEAKLTIPFKNLYYMQINLKSLSNNYISIN